MRTEPSEKEKKHQHHFLHAERASYPSIAEWIKGNWWCVNEVGPVSPEEMYRRGWRYGKPVMYPKEYLL